MTIVVGIDPGVSGSIALYDNEARELVDVYDMPNWTEAVGKKKRTRIDIIGLMKMLENIRHIVGAELVLIEAVGGRPGQSASAGFVFGYTVGLIYMACMQNRFIIESIPPREWKKIMKIPGKKSKTGEKGEKKLIEGEIMKRVHELFPTSRHKFAGPNGGYRMDRCDAALIAKFGGDHVWPTLDKKALRNDEEYNLAYRRARDVLST